MGMDRGGKLNLKGGNDSRGLSKKKKKKKKSLDAVEAGSFSAPGGDEAGGSPSPRFLDTRTDAQKRFEETRKKREEELIKKKAAKTHREKIEELNKQLSTMPEHYDIPRVGPG